MASAGENPPRSPVSVSHAGSERAHKAAKRTARTYLRGGGAPDAARSALDRLAASGALDKHIAPLPAYQPSASLQAAIADGTFVYYSDQREAEERDRRNHGSELQEELACLAGLAACYEAGDMGVPRDVSTATALYRYVLARGHLPAALRLAEICDAAGGKDPGTAARLRQIALGTTGARPPPAKRTRREGSDAAQDTGAGAEATGRTPCRPLFVDVRMKRYWEMAFDGCSESAFYTTRMYTSPCACGELIDAVSWRVAPYDNDKAGTHDYLRAHAGTRAPPREDAQPDGQTAAAAFAARVGALEGRLLISHLTSFAQTNADAQPDFCVDSHWSRWRIGHLRLPKGVPLPTSSMEMPLFLMTVVFGLVYPTTAPDAVAARRAAALQALYDKSYHSQSNYFRDSDACFVPLRAGAPPSLLDPQHPVWALGQFWEQQAQTDFAATSAHVAGESLVRLLDRIDSLKESAAPLRGARAGTRAVFRNVDAFLKEQGVPYYAVPSTWTEWTRKRLATELGAQARHARDLVVHMRAELFHPVAFEFFYPSLGICVGGLTPDSRHVVFGLYLY